MRLTALIITISLTHFASLLLLSSAIAIPNSSPVATNTLDTPSRYSQSLSRRGNGFSVTTASKSPPAVTAANNQNGGGASESAAAADAQVPGSTEQGGNRRKKAQAMLKGLFGGKSSSAPQKADSFPLTTKKDSFSTLSDSQLTALINPLQDELANDFFQRQKQFRWTSKKEIPISLWQQKTLELFNAKKELLTVKRAKERQSEGRETLGKYHAKLDEAMKSLKGVLSLSEAKGIEPELNQILSDLKYRRRMSKLFGQPAEDRVASIDAVMAAGTGGRQQSTQ